MVKDTKYIIKRIIIGVGIALILMLIKGSLIMDVEAQSGSLSSIVVYRGYTNGNYNESNNVRNQQLYGDLPFTVFAPYQERTVWGMRLLADFSNTGAFTGRDYQNKLDVYFRFDQSGANEYWNNSINASAVFVSNLNNYNTVSCTLSNQTATSRTYHCSGGFTNYEYPTTVNFVVGDPNNFTATSSWVSIINQYTSIDIGSITYSTTTVDNPNSANINDIKNNTTTIINNQTANTESIINNQNENTQKEIDSNITCSSLNANENGKLNGYLSSNGIFNQSNDFKTTRYIPINDFSKIIVLEPIPQSYAYLCFYNGSPDKLISCTNTSISHENDIINVPKGATEVRFSLPIYQNDDFKANFKICRSSNLALSDSLTDDDISNASNDFDSFIRNMNPNTHGLSDIITAPLRLVSSLTSSTCSPLRIPLPFVDSDVVLPCMVPIYQQYFGQWFNIYQLITTGVIAYWVCINFFRIIKNILDPTDDKVEVYDL